MTTYTLYRVNATNLAVEQITVTDIDSEHTDGALMVEVTPEGLMKSLNTLTYYAETESEAVDMLLAFIGSEIEKAEHELQHHEALLLAAKKRAAHLALSMLEMAMDAHEVPVK